MSERVEYVENDPFYQMGLVQEAQHCVGNILVKSTILSVTVIPVTTALSVAVTYAEHVAQQVQTPYLWTDALPCAVGLGYGASVAIAGVLAPQKYSRPAKTVGLLTAIGLNLASSLVGINYDSIDLFKKSDDHPMATTKTTETKSAFTETAEDVVSSKAKAMAWPGFDLRPQPNF